MVLVYLLYKMIISFMNHDPVTREHNHFDASKKAVMEDVKYIYIYIYICIYVCMYVFI